MIAPSVDNGEVAPQDRSEAGEGGEELDEDRAGDGDVGDGDEGPGPAEYADTVTFVHRYFPLPGHPNSVTAAIAVEAAAQQGAYESMYQKMFETQTELSHTTEDRSPVFRAYAEELGLDMAAYDAAVADPATRARIEADVADGVALGVQGTPTFFLDGQVLTLNTLEQFRAEVDAAASN